MRTAKRLMQFLMIGLLLFASFTTKANAEDEIETTTWVRAGGAEDIATIAANGKPVAITMTKNDVVYALPTEETTSKPKAIAMDKNDAGELLVVGSVSEYAWTITAVEGGYTITNDDGNCLSSGTTTSSVKVDNNPNGGNIWDIQEGYLRSTDYNKTLGVFVGSTTDWRVYSGIHANIQGEVLEFWTLKDSGGPTIPVESVTLNKDTLELEEGKTETLTATVLPENASSKTLTWSSSDEAVATVSKGLVTAVAAGTATITASANDGSGKSDSCVVTIKEVSLDDLTILDKFTEAPKNGSTLVIYYPVNDLVLSSTATVDKNNKPILAGTEAYWVQEKFVLTDEMAYLNVYLSEEGDYTFTDAEGKYLTSGDTGSTLVFADEASNYSLWNLEQQTDGTWHIRNKNALYNNSKPQYLEYYNGYGFTTYSYNSNNAAQYKFDFYGVQAETPDILVESLTLDKEELELEVGKKSTLTATVLPGNATNPAIVWSSSDETVATVSNGLVMALAVGTTTVTVATTDGSELTASCAVTVKEVDLESKTLYAKLSEAPETDDLIAIYHPVSKMVLTGTANSSKLEGFEGYLYDGKLEIVEEMAVLHVSVTEEEQAEGEAPLKVYTFTDSEGKYLTSGATGNSLSFADEASDYSLWTLDQAEDGSWFIVNKNAVFNGKKQAMEYFNNLFTTYSAGTGAAYKFELYGEEKEVQEILVESINVENMVMEIGESKPLAVTILPENATNKKLTYEVLDDIISVDENGLVTALKAGDTAIFVSATDGSGCTNTCFVTVNPLPEGTVLLPKLTKAPEDGKEVVIYYPKDAVAMTETVTTDGKKLEGTAARFYNEELILTEEMAVVTVTVNGDDYTFTNADGQYLTSGDTGNSLTFADDASDYSLWNLEKQTDGTWYIINKNAKYGTGESAKAQYLEYHYGFTTYSIKDDDTKYKFDFYGKEEEEPQSDYIRIYRESKLEESIKVADELKKVLGVDQFKYIIVAKDSDFADALSGSYLAARKNAPILLINNDNMEDAFAYIRNNLEPGMVVYVLGSKASIPETFEQGLAEDPYSVIRLAGSSRYLTNLEILEEAGMGSAKDIFVVTGSGFADSLSSASAGLPILMVDNSKTSLKSSQIKWLKSKSIRYIYVLGQEASINASLAKALKSYCSKKVVRIGGDSRWITTRLVADKFFPTAEYVTLATGNDYADGLIASPLAYALKSPLLMVASNKISYAKAYVQDKNVTKAYIIGSKDSISDEAARKILCIDESVVILEK